MMNDFIGNIRVDYRVRSEDLSDIGFAALGVSPRITRALRRGGIDTVEKATLLYKKDFLAVKGIGPKSFREIVTALRRVGLDVNRPLTEMNRGDLEAMSEKVREAREEAEENALRAEIFLELIDDPYEYDEYTDPSEYDIPDIDEGDDE